jgi:hypothetical protein
MAQTLLAKQRNLELIGKHVFLFIITLRWNYQEKPEIHCYLILNSHKGSKGKTLFEVLKQIDNFIIQNPQEFIIIKLQEDENELKGFCKNILAKYLLNIFGERLILQEDKRTWFQVHKVTVGELRSRKKNLLLLCRKEFFDDFTVEINGKSLTSSDIAKLSLKEKGIFDKERYIKDYWFNKDNAKELLKEMDRSFLNKENRVFRVSHYVFTPQKKFDLKYLINPPTIFELEKKQFLKHHQIMEHLVYTIEQGLDLNIGKQI